MAAIGAFYLCVRLSATQLHVSRALPATKPIPKPGLISIGGGAIGSTGWMAKTITLPWNPVQWANPVLSMVTPAGTGSAVNPVNDQFTGSGDSEAGGLLNVPVATNCTPAADPLSCVAAGLISIEVSARFGVSAHPASTISPRDAISYRPEERLMLTPPQNY
jgi:hypothetical protein